MIGNQAWMNEIYSYHRTWKGNHLQRLRFLTSRWVVKNLFHTLNIDVLLCNYSISAFKKWCPWVVGALFSFCWRREQLHRKSQKYPPSQNHLRPVKKTSTCQHPKYLTHEQKDWYGWQTMEDWLCLLEQVLLLRQHLQCLSWDIHLMDFIQIFRFQSHWQVRIEFLFLICEVDKVFLSRNTEVPRYKFLENL